MLVFLWALIALVPAAQAACDATTCSACFAQSGRGLRDGCGWCGELGGEGKCESGNTFGPSSGSCDSGCWNFNSMEKSCPAPCTGSTCAACVASGDGSCGWCETTRTCAHSDAFGKMCVKGHGSSCANSQRCLKKKDSTGSCPAVNCADYSKTCADCAAQAGCGWCSTDNKCIAGGDSFVMLCADCGDAISCYVGSATDAKCPAVTCDAFGTCGSCSANKGCGWCASEQKCIEGGDNFVSLCKGCDKGTSCYKGSTSDNCPTEVCSSLADCHACGSMDGCGWDAGKLTCVEVGTGNLNSCQGDGTFGCLYVSATDCPASKDFLCSSYPDCRSCTAQDAACGWSSALSQCVEATSSRLNGCRGGVPFSYFDCEAQCSSHQSDCGECHGDPAGCTWCAGELLNVETQRIERCVLAEGAQTGPGDETKTAYPHVCAEVTTKENCAECQDLLDCAKCTLNIKCGGCFSTDSKGKYHFNCTRGDKHAPYSSCPVPDNDHPPFYAQAAIEPAMTGSCTNDDRCHEATTCGACQLLEQQHGCAWCNDSVPIDGAKFSPCRPQAQCDAKHTTEKNKCPAFVPCGGEFGNVTCTECLQRHDCAWAGGSCGQSINAFSYSYFPYIWGRPDQCPEVCGAHTDCNSCGESDGCGWCPNSGCLPGDKHGPDYHATGVKCSPWVFGKDVAGQCAKVPGGGDKNRLGKGKKLVIGLAAGGGGLLLCGAFFFMRRHQNKRQNDYQAF
jgi:hypothetical protein